MKGLLKKLKFLILLSITPSFLINNLALFSSEINEKNSEEFRLKTNSFRQEYILGPGDIINLDFSILDLSIGAIIGPDGLISIPEVGQIYAEGYTLKELKNIIDKKYSKVIYSPDVNISIVSYRNVRVYLAGEVQKPGYYSLPVIVFQSSNLRNNQIPFTEQKGSFPTLFDAFKRANGISPYSDLSNIKIIRKNSISNGGGKITANINLISLFSDGDLSQNIRLYDGDSIIVKKSNEQLSQQLLLAKNNNINPEFINVFVSGYIDNPGLIKLPQGSTLNQAIAMVGGQKLLSGKVTFKRFNNDGKTNFRRFKFNRKAVQDSYKNPILSEGDIINIENSKFNNVTTVLSTVTSPIITIFGIKAIVED